MMTKLTMPTPFFQQVDAVAAPYWASYAVHPAYARALYLHLKRLDFADTDIFQRGSMDINQITERRDFLLLYEMVDWIEHAQALTGNVRLGWELGLLSELSSHGSVGFAAMTAPHVGALLTLVMRFAPLRECLILPEVMESSSGINITFKWADNVAQLRRDHGVKAYIQGHFTAALVRVLEAATGLNITQKTILSWPLPVEEWDDCLGGKFQKIYYSTDSWELYIPQEQLAVAGLGSDPFAHQDAVLECEAALRRSAFGPWVQRVYGILASDLERYHDLGGVAQMLHLSERTLIRKLGAEGSCFAQILDQVRLHQGQWYLTRTDLAVAEIAHRLGFQDASNFSRAFRRLSRLSPSDYRLRG